MRTGRVWFLIVTLVGVTLLMVGCAGRVPRTPIYADPDLANIFFDTVTVLPVVDRRVDKSTDVNLEKNVRGKAVKALEKNGYSVLVAESFAEGIDIPNDEVAEMEVHELATLGSPDTGMMLILFMDDASGATALGYSFKSEMTALLLDKSRKAMIWKDKGVASQGQGGLLGCAMSGSIKSECLSACVNSMLESFPAGPGRQGARRTTSL